MNSYLIEEPFELGNRPANREFHKGKGERCLVMSRQDCERLHSLLVEIHTDASEGKLNDYTLGICPRLAHIATQCFGQQYAQKICAPGFLWLARKWPYYSNNLQFPIGNPAAYHFTIYKFRGEQLRARLSCLEFCINYLAGLLELKEPAE